MRRCTECRSPVKKIVRESFRYTASGLPNVVLLNVPAYVCTECGEEYTAIPNIQGLHDTLASIIIEKSGQLTSDEVRFLRTWLDIPNVDFASLMGVTPSQASRWASGDSKISSLAGRLLRMLVARESTNDFDVSTLARIDRDLPPAPYAVTRVRGGWGASEVAQA